MKFLLLLPLFWFAASGSEKPRVFLVGDSTMAMKKVGDEPETGWGQVLPEYFTDKIEFQNHAVNGRSTKSFRTKGHWEQVYNQLKKDDYVLLQFGHNDAKDEDTSRYAAAHTTFKTNLIRYIDEIRSKGAIPILATPVCRRNFDAQGQWSDTHADYPTVMRGLADSLHVDLLDLHKVSAKILQENGPELSKLLFLHFGSRVFDKFPQGLQDNTHFSSYGAHRIASAAAAELISIRHPLRNYLRLSFNSKKYQCELPNVAAPVFKRDTFDIRRYGAVTSINLLNTKEIQQAIDQAAGLGGGVVLIPKGLWVTGPIELKDGINLHLAAGALLQFSDDLSLYPIVRTTWEGQEAYRCQAPISAKNKTNIAITGSGTVDGAGHVWKAVRKAKLTENQWKELIKTGGVNDGQNWYPSLSYKLGVETEWAKKITDGKTIADYEAVRDFLRPNFVSLISCNVVLIEGVTFTNSPAWTLHPLLCNHTTVRSVTVINPWYGQNNDAIDMESSRHGIIDNCFFDTGDDAITLKSGRDAEGRKRGIPTSHWIITNTTVLHGHGGFVVGSEMSGGVHHIFVDNCTFSGTDIGLRFKTTRGRGGVVSDIYVSNIQMTRIVAEAILFSMYYAAKDPVILNDDHAPRVERQMEPVTEATPQFRDIFMEHIFCKGASTALRIDGLPEQNVASITLQHASLQAEQGLLIDDASAVVLQDVELLHQIGPFAQVTNSKSVEFNGLNVLNPTARQAKIFGTNSKNILFKNMSWLDPAQLLIDGKVDKNQVKIQ